MIKRKFGMACLNISQGRFGGYSHKNLNAYDLAGMDSGIDQFKTFNDLEVIGVHEYSRTGFANTVCFFDVENNVTIAMTHMNSIPNYMKVGTIFHEWDTIYLEGTKGNATGNHIHLEIGKGKQPSKTKINGIWQLKNLINIEDYFYIDSSYTNVKEDKGYAFSYDGKEAEKAVKDRYQLIKWNGLDVHLYKGFNNGTYKLDLGLMSADGNPKEKALQTLDKIDYDVQVFAKVNCNYFVMTSVADHGQHLGVEQGFTNDLAPKQQGYVTVCVNKDDSIEIMDASEYWKSASEVKCAFTPFWVGLFNYNDADYYSTNFGDKRSLKNTQTALMRMGDGQWALAVFNTKCTCWDVRKFAKEYGAEFMCCLDSGGSSQMITEGTKRVYTGRAIANALCLYRVDLKQDDKPIEQEEKSEADKLKAEIESLKKELAEKNLFIEQLKSANIGYGKKLKKAYQRIADLNSEISKLRGE